MGKFRKMNVTQQVKDDDVALSLALVEPVRERRRGRLVEDANDLEARDGSSVLGRLALSVVEVGWDSDDGVLDWNPEVGFGCLLELAKHHRADLLGGERAGTVVDLHLDKRLAGRRVLDGERVVLEVALSASACRGQPLSTASQEAVGSTHTSLSLQRRPRIRFASNIVLVGFCAA